GVKFAAFATNVWSPRPDDGKSIVTALHAVSTALRTRKLGRTSSMRSVSPATFEPRSPSSQTRCPNSRLGLFVLMSFSIRSVARPVNGDELLWVGVVE